MYSIYVSLALRRESRVFNKNWQPAKFAGYCTWTCHLLSWEITPNFTNNMRNSRTEHKSWIGKVLFMKNKRDVWIPSNLGDDFCFPVHVKIKHTRFWGSSLASSKWCKLPDLPITFEAWQDICKGLFSHNRRNTLHPAVQNANEPWRGLCHAI